MGIDGYIFEVPENVKQLREKLKKIEEQNKKLFSGFTFEPSDEWKQVKERSSAITKELNQLSESICDALTDTWNETLRSMKELGAELSAALKNISKESSFRLPDEVMVIIKFTCEQYVFWDFFTPSFVNSIINNRNTKDVLFQYETENNYESSEKIIKDCQSHRYLQANRRLFGQAIEAYHEGKYDLAIVGLTATIDSVLTEATGITKHFPKERCKAIVNKLKANEHVGYEEYAIVTLGTTFSEMADLFYETIDFSNPEPNCLNRNWIMHGRSQREKTRLDCIKLLRFLYGIILVNRIDEQAIDNSSAENAIDEKESEDE